jgi:hypothetical protein
MALDGHLGPKYSVSPVSSPVGRLWPETDPEDGLSHSAALEDLIEDQQRRERTPAVERVGSLSILRQLFEVAFPDRT